MSPLTPLEIVRRTPKTNCGECNFPTCLAFAAAVAKTGQDPAQCPYIDLQGLPCQPAATDNIDNLPRQHDLALVEHLKKKIENLDFTSIADSLGADLVDADTITFSYLAQDVLVKKNNLLINRQEPEDPRDQILIYNYIASGGGRRPDNNWVGIESLPNSISKSKTLATYCEDRLAQLFSGLDHDKIRDLGTRLAGYFDQESSASVGVTIPVLPMIPQFLLFWDEEPEEGFQAKVKILFDQNVLDFLDLESLVFSAERLADRIAALYKNSAVD